MTARKALFQTLNWIKEITSKKEGRKHTSKGMEGKGKRRRGGGMRRGESPPSGRPIQWNPSIAVNMGGVNR